MDIPAWGSFEEWSRIVRHVVVWCGLPDPADTREELLKKADAGAGELRALIAGWLEIDPNQKGITASRACKW